jgi:hypothetical protein
MTIRLGFPIREAGKAMTTAFDIDACMKLVLAPNRE